MKKAILSILLALCMMCTLLPVTAGADEPAADSTNLEDVTFGYAYDAQRSPAFPQSGHDVTLSDFNRPLKANSGSGNVDRYSEANGSWKLVNSGKYATFKTDTSKCTSQLTSIVTHVATEYSVNADDILIHSLTKDGTHVIYGVVVIYNATAQRALFLGDNWNNSGAGYVLSKNAISETSITLSATTTTTDYVKGFMLSQSGTYNFTAANAGYTISPELTVTVTNIGNVATGDLTVALSGTNSGSFTLSKTSIDSIAADNGIATFTVKPNTGLTVGTYEATVTVSASGTDSKEDVPSTTALDDGNTSTNSTKSQSFNVSFTVNAAPVTPTVKIVDKDSNPISGTTVTVGDTLKAVLTNPSQSAVYTWALASAPEGAASTPITGTSNTETYTVKAADVGKWILVVLLNNDGTQIGTSGCYKVVAAPTPPAPSTPSEPSAPSAPVHESIHRQNTTTTTVTTPDTTTVASPKTGDMGIAVYAALSIMSMTGSAWIIGTKRRH